MVRKYVSKVTMSKLVSTLVSHSTQGDPRYDRSSTMCPWTWGKVCGIRTRSWRLATPRKTLENDDFTDLRILGGRARSGGRVRHRPTNQLTAGSNNNNMRMTCMNMHMHSSHDQPLCWWLRPYHRSPEPAGCLDQIMWRSCFPAETTTMPCVKGGSVLQNFGGGGATFRCFITA